MAQAYNLIKSIDPYHVVIGALNCGTAWRFSDVQSYIPPSANLVNWILGLVIFLCQVPTYVEYEKGYQLPENIPRDENVWTLIFRIEYGGMKGDIEMLTCICVDYL